MDGKALVAHKTLVALKSVDPERVNTAMVSLCKVWMGILAILKVKFARTVALGHAIGTKTYSIAVKYEPLIVKSVGDDYAKWVPLVVQYACKSIAISLAWWVQRVLS